jgi:hypothetical protein
MSKEKLICHKKNAKTTKNHVIAKANKTKLPKKQLTPIEMINLLSDSALPRKLKKIRLWRTSQLRLLYNEN